MEGGKTAVGFQFLWTQDIFSFENSISIARNQRKCNSF